MKMAYSRNYIPSPSQFCTSTRLRGKEYLRENTLHGFPYFVNPRRPLWERIVWFMCTGASIGAALGIIWTILTKFRIDPTITALDTHTDDLLINFPSVALCQKNPYFDFGDYEPDSEHYNKMYKWSWKNIEAPSMELVNETYGSFFHRTTQNCEDLYAKCVQNGKSLPCDQIMKKVIRPRGICCYIKSTKITKDTKPWMLSFATNAFPVIVDLFDINGSPARRDGPAWYYLETGVTIRMSIEFTYATEGIKSLTRGQRRCHYGKNAPSFSQCVHLCHIDLIGKNCECLPWFMNSSKFRECTRKEYDCLAANATILERPNCLCYLACTHSTFQFERLEYRNDNTVVIDMPNWPPLAYRRDVRFGWLDLVVSFGGIAGLFVGYSLLTSIELGYYFTLRSYCGAVLAETDKTIKIKVASAKQSKRRVKAIDIKNNYWDYVN